MMMPSGIFHFCCLVRFVYPGEREREREREKERKKETRCYADADVDVAAATASFKPTKTCFLRPERSPLV